MKNLIIIALALMVLSTSASLIVLVKKSKEAVFGYQQELRVQHEYLKACEAKAMYQDFILEKNGIESHI